MAKVQDMQLQLDRDRQLHRDKVLDYEAKVQALTSEKDRQKVTLETQKDEITLLKARVSEADANRELLIRELGAAKESENKRIGDVAREKENKVVYM